MSPQLISLMIGPDHPVPVSPQAGSALVSVDQTGGTVFYSDNRQVSPSSNQGSIAPGASLSFTSNVWLIANATAGVKIQVTDVYAAWSSVTPSVAAAPPRVNKLLVLGHSVPAGQNENALTGNRFPSVTALLIGATETNSAVGGSALCTDNAANRAAAFWTTSGGWITCMAANAPNRSAQTDFSGNVVSPLQAVILMHGYNDLGVIGPPGQSLANKAAKGGVFDTTFPPGLIAVINRLRAGHTGYVWNGTDSGSAQRGLVTLDANWTKTTGTSVSSIGFVAFPTTAGAGTATSTLTLPSWYPGGLAVDLVFVGSLNNQGSFTIKLNGTTIGVADGTQILATSDAGTREQTCWSYRIPGSMFSAGSQVIGVNANVSAGSPYFDSWSIEASTPPLIVIPKMYQDVRGDQQPPGNTDGTGAANYNVRNSDILALNRVLDQIAATYADGRVITVDTDSLIDLNPNLCQTGPDQIHPSMTGAGLIGVAVANAIQSYYAARPMDLALTGKG